MNDIPVIECKRIGKNYRDGKLQVEVLKGLDLEVAPGEKVAIIGPSGSGKSTLLHILGGLDSLSAGEVKINGQDLFALSDDKRAKLRNQFLGFIYQFHHLLPEFTAIENVAMVNLIAGMSVNKAKENSRFLLEQVGLGKRLFHKPGELSGGERQRVAIARAMANRPQCILADEPTGNLDSENAKAIMALLQSIDNYVPTSLVLVTHDQVLAKQMDRVLTLKEGQLHVG